MIEVMVRRAASDSASAAGVVTDGLRSRILDGGLGPGERLPEEALAAGSGVARHTVRTALRALAEERLVVIEPHRGARVAAPTVDGVLALYQLRSALEGEAARLALERYEGRLPDACREAAARLAQVCRDAGSHWPAVAEAHAGVHSSIVAAARAPRIEDAHRRLDAETRLFLLHVRPLVTGERLAREHTELIDELESDGPEALRRHLRASAVMLVDELDRDEVAGQA
ncbi:MAG: GntR family transcriptional regulator [Actinomycetota bacterium]|nr:GntR family transcriptional regulator [Actinomycetota bacterium]